MWEQNKMHDRVIVEITFFVDSVDALGHARRQGKQEKRNFKCKRRHRESFLLPSSSTLFPRQGALHHTYCAGAWIPLFRSFITFITAGRSGHKGRIVFKTSPEVFLVFLSSSHHPPLSQSFCPLHRFPRQNNPRWWLYRNRRSMENTRHFHDCVIYYNYQNPSLFYVI